MAYNAALNTVYNHYLTTYSSKSNTQYDTHKKSELRSIYNKIIKQHKDSPLFLIKNNKETQEFAINLKENSRYLRNTIASLGGLDEQTLLNQKSAFSSDDKIISSAYIGTEEDTDVVPEFNIAVAKLASPQTNTGLFLPSKQISGLSPDTYTFDVTVNDLSYEFQFNIYDKDTNKTVQERLSRLILTANIGLRPSIIDNDHGESALRITSANTGLKLGNTHLFTVSDDTSEKGTGAVEYFGLNRMTREPSNAEFYLNGDKRYATSNHFTVEKLYDITLHNTTAEGEAVTIGLKTDYESLTENISILADGFNSFLDAVSSSSNESAGTNLLLKEMRSISLFYKEPFNTFGFDVMDDGKIKIDKAFINTPEYEENIVQNIDTLKNFANKIVRKTNQISLDPMNYVDKKIVAYKNPIHNFQTPYITSSYSGMMFNGYC